jgi:hypothetical protein
MKLKPRRDYRLKVPPIGRRAGRQLTDLELRHLRLLLEIRAGARRDESIYLDLIEDFVLECRQSGASAHSIARQLEEVSSTTIQNWTKHAEQRRDQRAGR